MRVNRVERREHERRSGQDRRKMPDRKNLKMETIDRRKEEKRKDLMIKQKEEIQFQNYQKVEKMLIKYL